jgi:hypothetical protein
MRRVLFCLSSSEYSLHYPGYGSVSAYEVDANTGALKQIPGSPFGVVGIGLFSATVDPSAQFLYESGK